MDSFTSLAARVCTPRDPLLLLSHDECHALQSLLPIKLQPLLDRSQLDLTKEEEWDLWLKLEADCIRALKSKAPKWRLYRLFWQRLHKQALYLALDFIHFYKSLYQIVMGSSNLKQCHSVFDTQVADSTIQDCVRQQLSALTCYQSSMSVLARLKWYDSLKCLQKILVSKLDLASKIPNKQPSNPNSQELLLFMHCDLEHCLHQARSSVLSNTRCFELLSELLTDLNHWYQQPRIEKEFDSQQSLLNTLVRRLHNPYQHQALSLRASYRESYFVLAQLIKKLKGLIENAQSVDEIKFCCEIFWQLWWKGQQIKLVTAAQQYVNKKTIEPVVLRTLLQCQLFGCNAIHWQLKYLLQLERQAQMHADQPYLKVLQQSLKVVSHKIWLAQQLSHVSHLLPLFKHELALLLGTSHAEISAPTQSVTSSVQQQAQDQAIEDFVYDLSTTLLNTLPR